MSARQRKAKGERRRQHSAAARHKTAARRAALASGTLTGVLATSLTLGIAGPGLATASAAPPSAAEVKDINSLPAGGKPSQITDVGGTVFFTAFDSTHGRELWKSDGTTGGTTLVKDIDSGDQGSYPSALTDVGGTLYFVANDGTNGYELWKSDGTAAGTVLVKDISAGHFSSYPSNLTNVNGTLFFSANNGSTGPELWKSDGTEAGTVEVKDIRGGPGGSSPADLTNVNGTLFFSANDGSTGYELWKSDGTAAGTVLVKDINPGSGSGISSYYGGGDLTNVNGTLFFSANDGTYGQELWKSDGTEGGTVLIKDINPGSAYSNPANLTNVSGTLFFSADDGTDGQELWKSDGTEGGTVLVKDINTGTKYGYGLGSNPAGLTNVNGTLFFSANDGTSANEIWKSDGTGAGTVLVKTITTPPNGYPGNLTNVSGTLFFVANDGTTGRELWRSDGTGAGTVQVKDIDPGAASGIGYYGGGDFTDVNGTLFLVADDGTTGQQLWKSDGTGGGTVVVSTIDGGDLASNPHSFADVNGTVFFAANDGSGAELWKSDGSDAGTVLVKDINTGTTYNGYPAGSYPSNLTNVDGTLFFTADDGSSGVELWKSDGTEAGTVEVTDIRTGSAGSNPTSLTNVNGMLFFTANDGTHGYELWKSDGTAAGTVLVKDINTGTYQGYPLSSFPSELTNVNGTLFFTANDGSTGQELWKSNGTAAGTVLVKDIDPGGGSSIGYYGGDLTNANGTLFFRATDGSSGYELWKSDGTSSGTVLVKDIFGGGGSSYPYDLTNANGTLFFNANDGTTGRELWSSDGTAAGTLLVKDINPNKYGANAAGSYPSSLTDVNGTVFFSANDGTNGVELWKSDGSAAGTLLVKDINPGTYGNGYAASSYPSGLTNVNGTLFFTALEHSTGRELWASNGVGAGTILVKDIRPGSGSSFGYYSSGLFNENGTVFFAADDGATDNELWSATGSGAPLDPTSTSVTCAPSSVTTGQETTCTVTVNDTASTGATAPTGTVSFLAAPSSGSFGSTSCGLSSSGPNTATCDVTFTPTAAGGYSISGTYLGDVGHNTSHGADSLTAAIPVDPTSTAANCSPSSVTTGDTTTCTVTVTDMAPSGATVPTGTVSFSAAPSSGSFGSTSCSLSLSGPNTATCDVTFTPTAAGGYTITGTYGGDPGHTSSEANASLTATHGSGAASVAKIRISGTSAKVTIKCKGTTGQTCGMRLTMSVTETLRGNKVIRVTAGKTRKKTIVVGKAKKTIPAGRTVTVKVSLNSKAKHLLRRFHKLRVKLVVREQSTTIKTKKLTFTSKKH